MMEQPKQKKTKSPKKCIWFPKSPDMTAQVSEDHPRLPDHCLFASTPLTSALRRAARTLVHTSVYSSVPRKTTAVPTQCQTVKGFWKYHTETMRLRNFLRVTTRVTVSDAHSVVRMNTPRMHTYLRAGSQGTHSGEVQGPLKGYLKAIVLI